MKKTRCWIKNYPKDSPKSAKGQCCCNCSFQHPTDVCNCFDEWPNDLIINHSKYNKKHGSIGYACLCFLIDKKDKTAPVEISKHKHGMCEMWTKRQE